MDSETSYFDGLTPFEATQGYANATKELVGLLEAAGMIPRDAIPGWVAGAAVTALVEALSQEDD